MDTKQIVAAIVTFIAGGGALKYLSGWSDARKSARDDLNKNLIEHINRLELRIEGLERTSAAKDAMIFQYAETVGVLTGRVQTLEAHIASLERKERPRG